MKFEELTSAPDLLHGVRDLGWEEPTVIQGKAIPLIRAGRDVVGLAQTGTGKTGAFLLPMLEQLKPGAGLRGLILCPTRELAHQVASDARELAKHTDHWIGEVVGGLPIHRQIRDLRAGLDVVVATPGRLLDHVERGTVDLSEIQVLILDEADRMLDMGFRPQIEALLAACCKDRQTLLFSATMPNGVHALALRIMRDPEWVEAVPRATTADGVEQSIYPVRSELKLSLLVDTLASPDLDQVLVFTGTKRGADLVLRRLEAAGLSVAVLHGDRDMRQRRQALDAFTECRVRVLVATDVAQRGLDIEGISHVLNYDVPRNPEDYVHRIGRTGRAGATGQAITFMTTGELAQVHAIERMLGYKLPRVSIEGYDYGAGQAAAAARPAARPNRSGSRLGSRRADELSADELSKLLKVG